MSTRVANESEQELKAKIQKNLINNDNLMIIVELRKYNTSEKIGVIAEEIWKSYNRARVNRTDPPTFIQYINDNIERNAFNRDSEQLQSLKMCFSILQELGLGQVIGPKGIQPRTDEIQRKIIEQINELEQTPTLAGRRKTKRRKTNKRRKTKRRKTRRRKTKRRKTKRLRLKNN
jgi:hypothetical protein